MEKLVYRLAEELYRDYPDPMPAFVIRDEDLLQSALGEPMQTWGGRFLYPKVQNKAAALMRSLIKNHPFVDGNKRMGLAATEVFLLVNGCAFEATQEARVTFALELAISEPDMAWPDVSNWIRRHSMSFEQIGKRVTLRDRQLDEITLNLIGLLERQTEMRQPGQEGSGARLAAAALSVKRMQKKLSRLKAELEEDRTFISRTRQLFSILKGVSTIESS